MEREGSKGTVLKENAQTIFREMVGTLVAKHEFLEKDVVSLVTEDPVQLFVRTPSTPKTMWDYAKSLTVNVPAEKRLLHLTSMVIEILEDRHFSGGFLKQTLDKLTNIERGKTIKRLKDFIGNREIIWLKDSKLLRFTFSPHYLGSAFNTKRRREIYSFVGHLGAVLAFALNAKIEIPELVHTLETQYQIAPFIGITETSDELLSKVKQH